MTLPESGVGHIEAWGEFARPPKSVISGVGPRETQIRPPEAKMAKTVFLDDFDLV